MSKRRVEWYELSLVLLAFALAFWTGTYDISRRDLAARWLVREGAVTVEADLSGGHRLAEGPCGRHPARVFQTPADVLVVCEGSFGFYRPAWDLE